MMTWTRRWTTVSMAMVTAAGLACSGCASGGDAMMKKDDAMMKKDDSMMKNDGTMMDKK